MLSLFPNLLDLAPYAPFLFRIYIGCYLTLTGYRLTRGAQGQKTESVFVLTSIGALLAAIGAGLLLGIFVQLLAVMTCSFSMLALYLKKKKVVIVGEPYKFYILLGLVALSLSILGPGPYSIDLPL